jgi:putative transcriptional regulator
MKPEKSERNIAEELTQAAKEIKAHKEGKLHPKVVSNDIITARNNLELSQSQFAALLGVSKRTLEQWEQERRDPSQAAQRLIQIAIQRPDVLIELFGDAA